METGAIPLSFAAKVDPTNMVTLCHQTTHEWSVCAKFGLRAYTIKDFQIMKFFRLAQEVDNTPNALTIVRGNPGCKSECALLRQL